MSGEATRPTTTQPAEPPIAAPTEKIAPPGEVQSPEGAADSAKPKDDSFSLALDVPAEVKSGAEVVASVKITPGSGYKMNQEYPTKLTLQPTEGVAAAKGTLQKADAAKFDNHELAFNVKLTPAQAGTYMVRGTVAFAVCTENTCDPKTEKIAINLIAK